MKAIDLSSRHWNTGLVSSDIILTSWEEGASLALVGHPSSDAVTIKIPYGAYLYLIDQPCTPSFLSFNWNSLYATLNIHYKAWSYNKKKYKRIKKYKRLELLILNLKPLIS